MFRRWRYEWEAGIRAGGRRRSEGLRLDGDTSAWPTDSRDCDCARNLEASGKKHLSQSRELMSYETTEDHLPWRASDKGIWDLHSENMVIYGTRELLLCQTASPGALRCLGAECSLVVLESGCRSVGEKMRRCSCWLLLGGSGEIDRGNFPFMQNIGRRKWYNKLCDNVCKRKRSS